MNLPVMAAPADAAKVTKVLLTLDEAAFALSVGKTLLKQLVVANHIASVKLGRRRLIPVSALHQYIAFQLAAR